MPGGKGPITFQVTDKARASPTPAALGVIIVDEAVYALQEMQPGLEKVYFTLQEELLKPQAQTALQAERGHRQPGARDRWSRRPSSRSPRCC